MLAACAEATQLKQAAAAPLEVALILALTLVFMAGCSAKTEQTAPTAAPTVPETTTPPETTVPETEPPLPKLESGTIQGDNIPAIVCLLKKGDLVEVTG